MQAVTLATLGISALQNLKASPMQAARCSEVPCGRQPLMGASLPPKAGSIRDRRHVAISRLPNPLSRDENPPGDPGGFGVLAGPGASAPIPKFASLRGTLSCELRNQRSTSKYMFSSAVLDLKFLYEPCRTI